VERDAGIPLQRLSLECKAKSLGGIAVRLLLGGQDSSLRMLLSIQKRNNLTQYLRDNSFDSEATEIGSSASEERPRS
jgi:hypothetical protein